MHVALACAFLNYLHAPESRIQEPLFSLSLPQNLVPISLNYLVIPIQEISDKLQPSSSFATPVNDNNPPQSPKYIYADELVNDSQSCTHGIKKKKRIHSATTKSRVPVKISSRGTLPTLDGAITMGPKGGRKAACSAGCKAPHLGKAHPCSCMHPPRCSAPRKRESLERTPPARPAG